MRTKEVADAIAQHSLDKVWVRGSRWHHYAKPEHGFTLCHVVIAGNVGHRPRKPMCARCTYQLTQLVASS